MGKHISEFNANNIGIRNKQSMNMMQKIEPAVKIKQQKGQRSRYQTTPSRKSKITKKYGFYLQN